MVNFARLILKLGSSVAGFFGRFLGAEGLRRLRNKKRSIKRKIYPRENLNSYIQSQIRILERAAKGSMNILRPLSPHLPIYKPQLTSTFSIFQSRDSSSKERAGKEDNSAMLTNNNSNIPTERLIELLDKRFYMIICVLVLFVVLFFLYLFVSLYLYYLTLEEIIDWNKSLGMPIDISYGWREGVKLSTGLKLRS